MKLLSCLKLLVTGHFLVNFHYGLLIFVSVFTKVGLLMYCSYLWQRRLVHMPTETWGFCLRGALAAGMAFPDKDRELLLLSSDRNDDAGAGCC
jgi:hypothetical protein